MNIYQLLIVRSLYSLTILRFHIFIFLYSIRKNREVIVIVRSLYSLTILRFHKLKFISLVVRSFHSLTTMELAFVRKGRFGLPFLTLFKRARTHAYTRTRARVSLNAHARVHICALAFVKINC